MKLMIYGAQAIALGAYRIIRTLYKKQNIECSVVSNMGIM